MKKFICIITILTLVFLLACSNKGSDDFDTGGKSAAELAPEGMNPLTFGYGHTACKAINDYLQGEVTADDAKITIDFVIDQANKLELTDKDEGYGYHLSVTSYLDQFQYY